MKVYFSKENPQNWQVVPIPADVDNFDLIEVDDINQLSGQKITITDDVLKLEPLPVEQPPVSAVRLAAKNAIDDAAGSIYSKFDRFSFEYERRLSDAQAMAKSNYEGTPGKYLSSYMAASGLDAKSAVASVLKANEALNQLADVVQECRMEKFKLDKMTSIEEIEQTAAAIILKMTNVVNAFQSSAEAPNKEDSK